MLKIGITGGIGSGKSTVCRVFETLGIPVFYADDAAKRLMETDPVLTAGIRTLFGTAAYDAAGRLNRPHLSAAAFENAALLQQLNALVHPATIAHGRAWMAAQQAPYALKEAALFFETGTNTEMDLMIGVAAPEALRIRRAMRRDGASQDAVEARLRKQLDADAKMRRCDFVIVNDDRSAVLPQVLAVHQQLLERAATAAV